MRIVVLDGYSLNPGDLSWEPLKRFGEVTVWNRTSKEEILERARGAEILMVNKTVLDATTLKALPELRLIAEMATGYNNIDIAAAKDLGIIVCNVPAYSTDSVAQMVFAQILNVTNHVETFAIQSRRGRWSACEDFCYWDEPLHEITGLSLGILGLGNIGKKVAEIAKAFGMKVLAYTSKSQDDLPEGIRKVSLDELFGQSDILSLHCPLTADTKGIVNGTTLAKMKDGAILVNTGRGPLINDQDVAGALASGRLGAYCADVMSVEPPSIDNPLLSEPRAFLTPHVAWATVEARGRLMSTLLSNIEAYLAGEPRNVVNK